MRASASAVGEIYSAVKNSGYSSVDDCGSSLVSDTIAMFVEELKSAIEHGKREATQLAEDIDATADDFVRAETANALKVSDLIDAVKIMF